MPDIDIKSGLGGIDFLFDYDFRYSNRSWWYRISMIIFFSILMDIGVRIFYVDFIAESIRFVRACGFRYSYSIGGYRFRLFFLIRYSASGLTALCCKRKAIESIDFVFWLMIRYFSSSSEYRFRPQFWFSILHFLVYQYIDILSWIVGFLLIYVYIFTGTESYILSKKEKNMVNHHAVFHCLCRLTKSHMHHQVVRLYIISHWLVILNLFS